MSTEPRTQAVFFQGNQNAVEHDTSPHSALFYLFQEVSKLSSPIHNSFLDTNPSSTWLSDASRQNPFIVNKKEDNACSCQHGLSHLVPHDQIHKVQLESSGSESEALVEPPPECSSPWKVLSLINLQCEKLLCHSDAEETPPSSLDKVPTARIDATNEWAGGDSVREEPPFRLADLICDRQDMAAHVSAVKNVQVCHEGASSCCAKDCKHGRNLQSLTAENTDTVRARLREGNITESQHRDKAGDDFSVKMVERNQQCEKDRFPLDEQFSEETLLQTPSQVAFNSNENESVDLLKPLPPLDHNANLILTTVPLPDTQLPPLSSISPSVHSASPLHSPKDSDSHQKQDGHQTSASKPRRTDVPLEEETIPSCSTTPSTDPASAQKESTSTQQWRTKTPRKQPHPSRSADIQDPDFQGVSFRMDTELDDNREQCRLLITSKYSKELCKSARRARPRTRASQKSLKTSSSDEDSNLVTSVSKGKICASCCTRKTPMWRDAEDGTPLCNACGIRYKKYRVRCVNCWHIPRKEGNSNSCCLKCGNFVRLTSAQRKHIS
ncbi:uncharacterized protein V6R79_023321 [Siganus canaliculatus]